MVLSIIILVVVFVSALQLIVFNISYFRWHYEAHNVEVTTGMEMDDLIVVTEGMLAYLKDQKDSLDGTAMINGVEEEVFGQREKDHMVDVKSLYLGARSIQRVGSIIVVIILLYGWLRSKKILQIIVKGILYDIPILLLGTFGLGALFATDFDKYFTLFHQIFFTNDLWLLDPKTDILIHMVPEVYFYAIVMITLVIFIVIIAILMVVAIYTRRRLERILDVN
jgi:integral membrane protein (TIGR01906 family)